MGIVGEDWQSMLPGQSGNPKVVFRDRLACQPELMPDFRVNTAGFGGDIKDGSVGFQLIQPLFASSPLAG